MLKIFYLLNLLVFIISEEINQWKYEEDILFNTSGGNSTSLTSISSSSTSHYFFTYKNNEEEYIYSTELDYWWEIKNVTFSPSSINLDNYLYLMFTENGNKFYYLIKKNNKLNPFEIEDDTNIARLKGFKLQYSKTYTLIALIGTNKINYYQYDRLSIKLNQVYSFNFNIINIYGISDLYDYIYIYSYINENTTELAKYKFYNSNFNKEFSITLPIKKLYNITEVSKALDNEYSFLIFSYIKNGTDFYFYYFDYTDPSNVELKSFGNKYNFLPFRDAVILNAFFLKDTEYLYYLIIKDNLYNTGVLDVYNNLIIFNIKKEFIQFISFEKTNLIYGINEIVYSVCPFKTSYPKECPQNITSNNIIKTFNFVNRY